MGRPAHAHDWNEAYYILDGELHFAIDGDPLRSCWGDSNYLSRGPYPWLQGVGHIACPGSHLRVPAHGSEFFQEISEQVRTPGDLGKYRQFVRARSRAKLKSQVPVDLI